MPRIFLTEEQEVSFSEMMHYALGTQFGEVPHRDRLGAVKNIVRMHIEDIINNTEKRQD